MPLYSHTCVSCGHEHDSFDRGPVDAYCPYCSSVTIHKRRYVVSMKPVLQAGWNDAIGEEVSDHKRFAARLREIGERQTMEDGIPRKLVPVDYNDTQQIGATNEGLHESNVVRSRTGAPLLPMIGE